MNQNEPQNNNIQNNNQINNVVENNTITEPSNVENPNPTPIAEVKVEQPNMEPKTPNKSNKASTILLILLFIFFFALVMGMPYIIFCNLAEIIENVKRQIVIRFKGRRVS